MPTYMKMQQILAMIPVSRNTIERWIKKGEFPAPQRVGGTPLWDRDAVLKAIGHAEPKPARVHDDLI